MTLNTHPLNINTSYGSVSDEPSPLHLPRKPSPSFGGHKKRMHNRTTSDWSAYSSNYEAPLEGIRQVTYDDRDHISVLFQMHGSVWPRVLPYVIFNVLLTIGLHFAKKSGYDLTFDGSGHRIMAVMVSFLVVSRSKIQYGRFMEARKHLADLLRSCRELIHHMAILSMDDRSEGAKVWRQNVAYRTVLLLRVTIACLEYKSNKLVPWQNEMMSEEERDDLRSSVMCSDVDHSNSKDGSTNGAGGAADEAAAGTKRVQKWAHGKRSMNDEAFRAPIILAYNLRREIMVQRRGGLLKNRFRHVNEELKMLDNTSSYMKAFHELKKLVTTPFPFPLVQMARTFLFFWVFTLPFALCHEMDGSAVDLTLQIFVITYGFIGLEYVSMELDDPYGDDPIDFDALGLANMVFEDIYITLFKLDGEESAYRLRKRITRRMNKGDALANYQDDYVAVHGIQGVSPNNSLAPNKEQGSEVGNNDFFHDSRASHQEEEPLF